MLTGFPATVSQKDFTRAILTLERMGANPTGHSSLSRGSLLTDCLQEKARNRCILAHFGALEHLWGSACFSLGFST
jgi:hypothetical protein